MAWPIALACVVSVLIQRSAGKVLVLNDTNFDSATAEGDFLIDIYAPWCAHCKQLEPIWEKVAERLKGQVHVAKIDGTENGILLRRFYTQKFPTIIHLKNGETRQYSGPRGEKQLTQFALEGWKAVKPWPFYMAPNSGFGRAIGVVLRVPLLVKGMYNYLHGTLRLPILAVIVIFLTFPILLGVAAICFLDYWHTTQQIPALRHAHQQ